MLAWNFLWSCLCLLPLVVLLLANEESVPFDLTPAFWVFINSHEIPSQPSPDRIVLDLSAFPHAGDSEESLALRFHINIILGFPSNYFLS